MFQIKNVKVKMENYQLKGQLKKFPAKPGIYLFRNSKNKPLYIGKALNLKNRAKNYLKTDDPRLTKMISESVNLEFIQTDSDIEALILESQYIKKYQPPFNIVLRDDKQYAFLVFTEDEYPKIFITHQPIQGEDFIGPFTEVGALKTTLRLLRKIFPYCTCKQLHNNYCLNYHIGKCLGVCCLKQQDAISNFQFPISNKYRKNIESIKNILSGKKSSLIKNLEKEMKFLSDKQEYEKASELQYKIEKLKRVFQNAQIIGNWKLEIGNYPGRQDKSALVGLQKLLKLKQFPARIEAYDIANIQGKHAVGGMAVFINGIADKNEYRKFKIYTKSSPDDTAMLAEVLTRRFNHPEWQYPDLILVDGGKAQLNAADGAISNFQFPISKKPTLTALTKNERHVGEKLFVKNKKEAMPLSKLSINVKNLLLQIDGEAHRFAISYYRKMHRKSVH